MSKRGFGDQNTASFEAKQIDLPVAMSYLGTNVQDNLVIEAGIYIDPKTGNQVSYAGVRIDTVLFNVIRPKHIVSETVLGRDGEVNEYIAAGDYLVDIAIILSGISTDTGGGLFRVENIGSQHPSDDLAKLLVILNAPAAIPVTSRFLNFFGITDLIFKDFAVPQRAGGWSNQELRIQAKSEIPLELEGKLLDGQ